MAVVGDLKGETEREIMASINQAFQTKYHVTKIRITNRNRQQM